MPPTQTPPPHSDPVEAPRMPRALKLTGSLAAVGALGFIFVYGSLSQTTPAPQGQAAAAAATQTPNPFSSISVEEQSAFVVDMTDGTVLYEKNPDVQQPLASVTKVALALVVADALSSDASITIPYDTSPEGSAMRLAKGQVWTVRDVLNFTLIASSNNGADILAAAADSAVREKFPQAPEGGAVLWRMNDLAKELGMRHTYFLNANGLDISETQSGAYGSARDIAKLFAYALTHSSWAFSGTTRDAMLLTDETGETTSAFNTNKALGEIPGLIMGKTGFTDLAGGNLAVAFDIGLTHPVIAVVLHSSYEGRFADMRSLVDATRALLTQ